MPLQGYRHFGCINCEFRGTKLCDLRVPKTSQVSFKSMGIEFDSICEKKYWYVLSTYTGRNQHPTYKEIVRDYNRAMQNDTILRIKGQLNKIEQNILIQEEKIETEPEGTNEYYNAIDALTVLKREHFLLSGMLFNNLSVVEKQSQKDEDIDIRRLALTKESTQDIKQISIQQLNVLINNSDQELKKLGHNITDISES